MPFKDARPWLLLAILFQTATEARKSLLSEPACMPLVRARRALRENKPEAARVAAAAAALELLDEAKLPVELRRKADGCQRWAEVSTNSLLAIPDPAYPPLLLTTADPPAVLFIRGNPLVLLLPQLAIVGTRKPSSDGKKLAHKFAVELGKAGYSITSGLALGIDAAGHEGALFINTPTIAVMGAGLNTIYPERHHNLARAIEEQGALVSEFTPDSPPQAWQFPQRNRIISGLSHGVLVVEAALSSGSLITARLAADQGREIFVIPGSIHNPMTKGCHQLIRQGAVLVETVEDILCELGSMLQWEQARLPQTQPGERGHSAEIAGLDAQQAGLLAQIAYNPVTVDELSATLNISVEELFSGLMRLELEGLIERNAAGYVRTC